MSVGTPGLSAGDLTRDKMYLSFCSNLSSLTGLFILHDTYIRHRLELNFKYKNPIVQDTVQICSSKENHLSNQQPTFERL